MNYSEHPGTQIGVQVSPLFIDGFAMIKLKITVMSKHIVKDIKLTMGLHTVEFIGKDCNHIKSCYHHAKTISIDF